MDRSAAFAAAILSAAQTPSGTVKAIDAANGTITIAVGIEQFVDPLAGFIRRIAKAQQGADLIQSHVQRSAMADEGQTRDMHFIVEAIVAFGTPRRRQQLFSLIVTNGLH